VGEVKVFIELENAVDRENFLDARIKQLEIRAHATEALVDTGAVMLMLPEDIVKILGLKTKRSVIVTYADERKESRDVAGPVIIKIKDRFMTTECVIGPALSEPLIGQIVLETLDLIVDCQRQTLSTRPESPLYPLLKLK